jgi:LysR family transcriptional regulator, mexEF-oprN operon transcriptional activator
MLQTLDMNLFVVLHTLMEERSVTRAAKHLGKTQSAVSNALKRLREHFDDPLFVRTPKGLAPTPRAEELGRATREIVALAERCLDKVDKFDPATSAAHFSVGAPDRLSLPVFLPFLCELSRLAPGLCVDLRTTDRDRATNLIETGEIDIALGWFDRLPSQINSQEVFSEELVCIFRRHHPLLKNDRPVTIDKVLSFPHLVVSSGGDRKAAFDSILARIGRERRALTSLSNFTLVPDLLKQSDLIGVFTRRTALYYAKHHRLATCPLPLDIEPISHVLIWHRRYDTDRMHQWFREQLMLHCKLDSDSADLDRSRDRRAASAQF